MLGSDLAGAQGYAAPRCRAPEGATWIHALHGNVPDHQIDFICCPEAPQGSFTRTHLGHLSRLMKYLEPRTGSPFAFAIGNLSRDDSQHEPGHGAVALIFGFRVVGAIDSAGRQDPPLAHAIAAADRELTYRALLEASLSLHGHLAGRAGARTPGAFYREYARAMAERPEEVPALLAEHFQDFEDLPEVPPSALEEEWADAGGPRPARLFVIHDEDEPFGGLVDAAARLAAVLIRSDLRWTSIVCGGVADIPGGISVELVTSLPPGVGPEDRVIALADLPDDEDAIARELFGARRLARWGAGAPAWRATRAPAARDDDAPTEARPLHRAAAEVEVEIEIDVDLSELNEPPRAAAPAGAP